MRITLSKLTERSLEVVGLNRQVVVVGRYSTLHFTKILAFGFRLPHLFCPAHRIGATMIHVIAQEVATTTQFHERHRVCILWIEIDATMITRHHASSQFASEIRILLTIALVLLLLAVVNLFGGDGIGGALCFEMKCFPITASRLSNAALPKAVGIVAIKRKHLAERHRSCQFGPTRAGVEWQVESDVECNALECHQITASAPVFVVELTSHDRTAILPLQSLNLREDLAIERFHFLEEQRVLGTHSQCLAISCFLREHPVGNTTIAHLPVAEWSHAQYHGHSFFLAYLYESAQVALTTPVEHAFHLFDMIPEYVGSNNSHTAFLHLPYFRCPFVFGNARVVYFSHDGTHALAIDDERIFVPTDFASEWCLGLCARAPKEYGKEYH